MSAFERLVGLCLLLFPFDPIFAITFPPPPPSYSCVWYQDNSLSFHQVKTDTTEVAVNSPLPSTASRLMAMNASDCGAWILDGTNLFQLDYVGNLVRQITLRDLDPTLATVFQGSLNTYDQSLWLSDGRKMLYISSQGILLAKYSIAAAHGLASALDEGIWTLDKSIISHYNRFGSFIAAYKLDQVFVNWGGINFAVDSINGKIWASQRWYLARMDIASPAAPPVVYAQPGTIQAFTLNPESGTVWLVANDVLYNLDLNGGLLYRLDLAPLKITGVTALSFDPTTRSLWALSPNFLSRFSANGVFEKNLPAINGKGLITPAFLVSPVVSIIKPAADALINNAAPPLTVAYDALCNNQLCNFVPSYFAGYSLTATLNALQVGPQFVFNPTTHQANFTPVVPLPDGPAAFTAYAVDAFGHQSYSLSNSFTIDTVAPNFSSITPSDNTVVSNPNITIKGSVDDAAASVIFSDLQNWSGVGINPATQNFSWSLTLNPGLNVINLSAVDRAGNIRPYTLHLTYEPEPISVTISSPSADVTVADSFATVTGVFTGPPNTGISVNGNTSPISGKQFSARVPLQGGSNIVTVTATSPTGATASKSVNITSNGTQPISITATATEGLAPLNTSFALSSSLTVPIVKIDWDLQGNKGFYSSTIPDEVIAVGYTAPGVYQVRATATDNLGNIYRSSLPIVVRSYSELADSLRATYNGMLGNLRAGNIDAALSVIMPPVVEKYRAIFTSLGSSLSTVVNGLGTFQDGAISTEYAEFFVTRGVPAGPEIYPIYFLRSDDGVWRIDGM